MNKEIWENFAYLRDVLGVRFVGAEVPPSAVSTPSVPASALAPVSATAPAPAPVEALAPAPDETALEILADLEAVVRVCEKCRLSRGRKKAVFGSGPAEAAVMFIGEGPGEQEDAEGLPFIGAGGQLLSKMIEAMGLQRENVYLANIIKCRPPLNRAPEELEISQCSSYIDAQIKLVNPKIIIVLGDLGAQSLLETQDKVAVLRGKLIEKTGRKYLATYHPNELLRNPALKKAVWEDLQFVMQELGLKPLKK